MGRNRLKVKLLAMVFLVLGMVLGPVSQASAVDYPTYEMKNCVGHTGVKKVCIDPTTGYGPLVYIYLGTKLEWAYSAQGGACNYGYGDKPTFVEFEESYDAVRYWNSSSYTIAISTGRFGLRCGQTARVAGAAVLSSKAMNEFRWITNAHGVTNIQVVL